MTLHVDPLEALWFVVNLSTLALTLVALRGAWRDLAIARGDASDRHELREITARGNVRREALRLVVQLLLLSVVVPALFTDRPVTLSPPIIALILVPAVLLASTIFDARERTVIGDLVLEGVKADREKLALETSVQLGIELTREGIIHAQAAGEKADAAYHEANSVNTKIADLTRLVAGKEDKQDGDENPLTTREPR
jgi:hypothetical protein